MSLVCFFVFLQSGEASQWRVCYQRGLPRLGFLAVRINQPPAGKPEAMHSTAGSMALLTLHSNQL